ncbi:MAG TPA: tyrosine--tRNA ligase [Gemmatimonadales bacterium]
MSSLHDILSERGLVHDATPGAAERLAAGPIAGYVGFDPTADSLHVGSLVPVMALSWLQRTGGRPIVLLGGGTGMIGDPSGKRSERPVMALEQIDANARALEQQLGRFLRFDGPNAAVMLDNARWLRDLRLMDFLRDTGRHFTVNYMLQKEAVKSRMETGISFTEFSYMLIQAFDFWQLFRTEQCELQLGGSDQWGNITAGIELIARREGRQVHGVVLPLLTTAGGAKFGKSEGGNVWLDAARTNPYEFYQFWLNTDDRDVERFLRFFTFLPLAEIRSAIERHAEDPARREGQRLLAREVTALVHGASAADAAIAASAAIFGGSADDADYAALAGTMPNSTVARAELDAAIPLADVLVRAGLASSKSDARRGIAGRGYSVNESVVSDGTRRLSANDVRQGKYILLRKGKKTYAMLVVDG